MAGEGEDKKTEEEEEQFIAVEEDPNAQGSDEKLKAGEELEDEDLEDEDAIRKKAEDDQDRRVGAGREEDDEDDKKSRRRDENKTRRQRQKEARERTDRELNFLRNRNAELETRFSKFEQETDARIAGSEISTIDSDIKKAKGDLALANQVIATSAENNKGADLAEALDHRDAIRDSLRELENAKEYLAEGGGRGAEAPPMDPRHQAYANAFVMEHDWWDPNGRDADSKKVLEIDRSLVVEGYDPRTKEYWNVLRERVQEALPDHFETQDDQSERGGEDSGNGKTKPKQSRGPQFRTGGRERPLKKNEVYISPERKEAMIEAGVWEDPVLRNRYLKSYSEYDRAAQDEGA